MSRVSRLVVNDPGGAKDIIHRGRNPREKAKQKWRTFMKNNKQRIGQSIDHSLGRRVTGKHSEFYQTPYEKGKEPNREPCTKCGIRGELGCRHRKPFRPPPELILCAPLTRD